MATDQLTSPDEQAQAEIEYAEARRQELIQQQQTVQAQATQQEQQGVVGAVTQVVGEEAKAQLKKQAKRAVIRWLVGALVAILGNPLTWIILAAIVVVVLISWCANNVDQCIAAGGDLATLTCQALGGGSKICEAVGATANVIKQVTP